jgi:hypothetical protein
MKSKTFLIALALVASLALLPGVASACTERCLHVEGGGTFCRQCVDTGVYTGGTCESSGPCGCFYTQNTCGLAASGIQPQTQAADLSFLASSEAPVCQATETVAVAN